MSFRSSLKVLKSSVKDGAVSTAIQEISIDPKLQASFLSI